MEIELLWGSFPTLLPKHFSYLCEYAIRCALSCSFCAYSNIFHCLHCSPSCFDPDSLLLAYLEAVPRTPWPGYGIQPVSGPLTPCTEGKTGLRSTNPMYGRLFCAVKPRIGNRCTASGDLYIRTSGINRVFFSYCFRQVLRFLSDTHCFDCWRLDRDFTVTASLTVYNGNFNAIRHEGSKAFRNCMDASAIFIINTRNLNPNFSGCRNRIFDFDIPALDLTSFEWTYVLPYARINFPFILPSICLKDMGKTKLIREATCEGHISCCLRGLTVRKRGMYSQYP